MSGKIKIVKSFTGYLYAEGDRQTLTKFLEYLRDVCGRNTADVEDAIRILKNFNVFYDMMRRKFKDFIAPKRDEANLIRGHVTIDKIKLIKNGSSEYAVIVFDKRINLEILTNTLNELGIEYEVIEG